MTEKDENQNKVPQANVEEAKNKAEAPNVSFVNEVNYPHDNNTKPSNEMAKYEEDKGFGGILALLLIVGMIIFVLILAGNMGATAGGKINGTNAVTFGQENTLSYENKDMDVSANDQVMWYVNDKLVQRKAASDKTAMEYKYKPDQLGNQKVKVVVGGRVYNEAQVNVAKKPLKVNYNVKEITYGDDVKMDYQIDGFLNGDSQSKYRSSVYYTNYGDMKKVSPSAVGVYNVRLEHNFPNSYDTKNTSGVVHVVPRPVTVTGDITKVYDGTNYIENPQLELTNVIEGEDVKVVCDKLYFNDKKAGEKTVSTCNLTLVGEDAGNYTIGDCQINAVIAPREITLTGAKALNKNYDGTTEAKFYNNGELSGVIDNDIVHIDSVYGSYDNKVAGFNKKVKIDRVNLIGADSCNYCVKGNDTTGNIFEPQD